MRGFKSRWAPGCPIRGVGKPGNPPASGAGERRFESDRPDWLRFDSGEARAGPGAGLLPRSTQVRFLPPELLANIDYHFYDAGHMMYVHEPSMKQLRKDVEAFYELALKPSDP